MFHAKTKYTDFSDIINTLFEIKDKVGLRNNNTADSVQYVCLFFDTIFTRSHRSWVTYKSDVDILSFHRHQISLRWLGVLFHSFLPYFYIYRKPTFIDAQILT